METNSEEGKGGVWRGAGHPALLLQRAGVLFVYFTKCAPGRTRWGTNGDTVSQQKTNTSPSLVPRRLKAKTKPLMKQSQPSSSWHLYPYNLFYCCFAPHTSCPVKSRDSFVLLWLWFKGFCCCKSSDKFWALRALNSQLDRNPSCKQTKVLFLHVYEIKRIKGETQVKLEMAQHWAAAFFCSALPSSVLL